MSLNKPIVSTLVVLSVLLLSPSTEALSIDAASSNYQITTEKNTSSPSSPKLEKAPTSVQKTSPALSKPKSIPKAPSQKKNVGTAPQKSSLKASAPVSLPLAQKNLEITPYFAFISESLSPLQSHFEKQHFLFILHSDDILRSSAEEIGLDTSTYLIRDLSILALLIFAFCMGFMTALIQRR